MTAIEPARAAAGRAGGGMPWAPFAAAASVVAWAAWAALFNQAQFGDNIEQFNWSHSLEWGYAKHPPLPTWLMGAAIAVFGRVPALGYAVAALCFAATAAFTWDIARRLLGDRAAAAAMLLWTLQFSFSWRAQLYNHNTALVVCVAAAAWAVLKALDGGFGWWLAAGAAAGAALLSKYQALVPLGGLLLALAWSGRLKQRRHAAGAAVATALALALFAPHAVWVTQHDFTTLRYAATSVDADAAASPAHAARSVLAFAVNQLRMLSVLLLAALLYAGWRRWRPLSSLPPLPAAAADDLDARRWLAGLTWAPALLLVATAVAGVNLRNHWGVQMFQFVSLWIAWRWQRRGPIAVRRLAWIALALHAALLAGYAAQHLAVRAPDDGGRRLDTFYPARGLARAVAAEWRAAGSAPCPLRYVSGDAYLAGLAALYGGEGAAVYGDAAETPWIDDMALARAGHVAVVYGDGQVPAGAARVSAFTLATAREPRVGRTVLVAVVLPAASCR